MADPPSPTSSPMDMNTDMDQEEQLPAPAPFPERADWGDQNEWHWRKKDQKNWKPVSELDDWQLFMNFWLDTGRAADLDRNIFPHELQIFPTSHFDNPRLTMADIGARPLLRTLDGRILVLERYGFLYHSLKQRREERHAGGAVLGGQSGIGKSLILWYFLVRLIQDRQPVVLHLPAHTASAILFYDCKAWRHESFKFLALPFGPEDLNGISKPVFVLVDSAETVPRGMIGTPGWPIYALSSTPGRSHEFIKERQPFLWGLDLWTLGQLRLGLKLQLTWPSFLQRLEALLQAGTPNTTALEDVVSIENMSRYKEWPKKTVDDWIEMLLDNAIYWCGWTARDVFGIILILHPTYPKSIIEASIPSDPLKNIASLLSQGQFHVYYSSDPITHKILALKMQPHSLTSARSSQFQCIIKSQAVWKVVEESISNSDDATIRNVFNSLRAHPSNGGYVLAGHIFAHYALGRMIAVNPVLPLKEMYFLSGTAAQPTFAAAESDRSAAPKGVYPSYVRPSLNFIPTEGVGKREWHKVNYRHGPLEAGVFYVPVYTNHPLINAFFLDHNPREEYGVLWMIQFTTARERKGAAEGLVNVQCLLKLARPIINKQIHVRWVLVTPTSVGDISDKKWQMPPKWNQSVTQNDHRGYLWLQEVHMNN